MVGFIIGTGRCGSTMLAQMLNSHSQVCVPFELQILFEYSNNGARLYEIFKEEKNKSFEPEDFIDLIEAKSPHKFHEYFNYRRFFEKQQYPIRNLKKLANSLFSEIAESKNKKIFIEQTPWYGQRIDILNELFPDAKYIHMVRDGRDVAISFARTPWWHNDIGQNLERWHLEVRRIIESSSKILDPNQILQIRYEDFVDQPKIGLKRICSFLDIHFENAMLDPTTYIDYGLYGKSNTSSFLSAPLNEWAKNKKTPVFEESRFAWKRHPECSFASMSNDIKQSLEILGYETNKNYMAELRSLLMAARNLARKGF